MAQQTRLCLNPDSILASISQYQICENLKKNKKLNIDISNIFFTQKFLKRITFKVHYLLLLLPITVHFKRLFLI